MGIVYSSLIKKFGWKISMHSSFCRTSAHRNIHKVMRRATPFWSSPSNIQTSWLRTFPRQFYLYCWKTMEQRRHSLLTRIRSTISSSSYAVVREELNCKNRCHSDLQTIMERSLLYGVFGTSEQRGIEIGMKIAPLLFHVIPTKN